MTGVLVHTGQATGELAQVVPMSRGAIVCDAGSRMIETMCRGGDLVLAQVDVGAEGDWAATGSAIYESVSDYVREHGEGVDLSRPLAWSSLGDAAWSLPVGEDLVALVPGIASKRPLLELLPSPGQRRSELLVVVEALQIMGLLRRPRLHGENTLLSALRVEPAERFFDELLGGLAECDDQGCPDACGCPLRRSSTPLSPELHLLEQERLLATGRARLKEGAWREADVLLSRARDLRVDNPAVLANLALARYHNAGRPTHERVMDARSLLLFARSLVPDDPEVHRVTEALIALEPWIFNLDR